MHSECFEATTHLRLRGVAREHLQHNLHALAAAAPPPPVDAARRGRGRTWARRRACVSSRTGRRSQASCAPLASRRSVRLALGREPVGARFGESSRLANRRQIVASPKILQRASRRSGLLALFTPKGAGRRRHDAVSRAYGLTYARARVRLSWRAAPCWVPPRCSHLLIPVQK